MIPPSQLQQSYDEVCSEVDASRQTAVAAVQREQQATAMVTELTAMVKEQKGRITELSRSKQVSPSCGPASLSSSTNAGALWNGTGNETGALWNWTGTETDPPFVSAGEYGGVAAEGAGAGGGDGHLEQGGSQTPDTAGGGRSLNLVAIMW